MLKLVLKLKFDNYLIKVILSLLKFLNLNSPGYYVEFGTEACIECNTRHLRTNYNWSGLLMDGTHEIPLINLHKEKIMHNNILGLFEKYKVPSEFELFSEDTDYAGNSIN